jgi:hypothetical protein
MFAAALSLSICRKTAGTAPSSSSSLGEAAVEVVVEEVVENQTAGVVEKEAATAYVIGEEIVEQTAMDTKSDPEAKQSEHQDALDKATQVIEEALNETVVEERCNSEHLGARRSCNCSSRGWNSQRY